MKTALVLVVELEELGRLRARVQEALEEATLILF